MRTAVLLGFRLRQEVLEWSGAWWFLLTSGTGTCTSTVTWAADASYNGATLSQFTTASKAPQTISFTSTAPSNAVYGGPTYSVSATGGGSGNAVTFGSSTPAICAGDCSSTCAGSVATTTRRAGSATQAYRRGSCTLRRATAG